MVKIFFSMFNNAEHRLGKINMHRLCSSFAFQFRSQTSERPPNFASQAMSSGVLIDLC